MLDKLIGPTLPPTFDPKKLRAHPIAEEFPMMERFEFEGLKANMKKEGFRDDEPIWLFGDPLQTLDGRNRLAAALELGITLSAKHFRIFVGTYEEAQAFSNRKNGHRRHLTAHQKDERVRAYIGKHPKVPSREVAGACGVSHTHVLKIKKEMNAGPPKSEDDKKLENLAKEWEGLDDQIRERFVEKYADDLRAMLAD